MNKKELNGKESGFPISIITCEDKPLNKVIWVEGDELHSANNYDHFLGDIDVYCCPDICALKHVLDNLESNQCVIPGFPLEEELWPGDKQVEWLSSDHDRLDRHYLETRIFWQPVNKSGLMVFEVEAQGEGVSEVLTRLCLVDPNLAKAGHLLSVSTDSYIYDIEDEEYLTGPSVFRFIVQVKDGDDISRYGAAFLSRCAIRGYDWVELVDETYEMRHRVNHNPFFTNHLIISARPELDSSLAQYEPGIHHLAGGILDTKQFSDLTPEEKQEFENSILEAMKPHPLFYEMSLKKGLKGQFAELHERTRSTA